MTAKIYPSHGLVMIKRKALTGSSQNFRLNVNFLIPDITVSPEALFKRSDDFSTGIHLFTLMSKMRLFHLEISFLSRL